MSIHFSDSKRAFIVGLGLISLGALWIFVLHPAGFEGGIGQLLMWLPGAIVAARLGDHLERLGPRLGATVFGVLMIGLTSLWYWAIGYVLIKVCRFIRRVLTTHDTV